MVINMSFRFLLSQLMICSQTISRGYFVFAFVCRRTFYAIKSDKDGIELGQILKNSLIIYVTEMEECEVKIWKRGKF